MCTHGSPDIYILSPQALGVYCIPGNFAVCIFHSYIPIRDFRG